MPTMQQHMQALQRARAAGDDEAVQYIRAQALKQQKAEDAKAYDPSKGMSTSEKVFANLGAGFDQALTGGKQLLNKVAPEGSELDRLTKDDIGDEAIHEKRRINERLAGTLPLGIGTGLQVAGELAPVVVGGGAIGVGARALPAAVQASRGMQIAGRAMGSAPLRGAVEGAAAGALGPVTSDESRLQNAALAAAGGAAAPYVLKGAVAAGRGAKNLGTRAAAALEREGAGGKASQALGERRVAAKLAREGIDLQAPGVDIPAYVPHPYLDSKASAAVAAQNPKLASLELASRNASRDEWLGFDQANQAARWKHLDEALQTSDDVGKLLGEANEIGAKVPYQATGPRLFNRAMDDFYENLQQAKSTAQYHGKPAVRSAVDYIENTMRDAGTVTPELVHQMKQTLQKGLTGAPGAGEAGVRAAASEPYVISLTKALDDVLDASSKGGKWSKWKAEYGGKMTQAEAAKADVNIRNKFIDEATGTVKKNVVSPAEPGSPVVTGHALKQAVAAAGSAKRGPMKGQNLLRKESERALKNVEQDLTANDILRGLKASSTGGGGSDTAPNMAANALLGVMDPTTGFANYMRQRSNFNIGQAERRELARLLQNPDALRAFLRQQALRQQANARLPYVPYAGAGVALPALAND